MKRQPTPPIPTHLREADAIIRGLPESRSAVKDSFRPRVTLVGREMTPDRWDDLLASCLSALRVGREAEPDDGP